ncbi:MAG: hypothetical protein ABSG76_08770 [Xanthobacteraceae bacterium]
MSLRSVRWNATAVALVLSLLSFPGQAEQAGPFAALRGSWSGSGIITMSNGANERIRCRAAYLPGSRDLQLTLRCASDSYNFNLASDVHSEGGALSGSWTEATRNASGSISGRVSGSQIEATAKGGSFAANLLLVTRGARQSVSIRAAGADITGVDIALNRQ